MSIKIQINSLGALERLIGDDTQLEIEIRNSIVQEFAKKHLKAVAKEQLTRDLSVAIQAELRKEFFEEVKNGSWGTKTVFSMEILNQIKEKLRDTARLELAQIVRETVEEQKSYMAIMERLQSTADWITEQLGPQKLEDKLEKMVNERLKEKLGL